AEARDAARQARYLAIEHIEQIRDNQNDASPKELAHAKQQAGADIDSDSYHRQDVRIDVTVRQPAHHLINYSLAGPANAGSKHSLPHFPSKNHKRSRRLKPDIRNRNKECQELTRTRHQ